MKTKFQFGKRAILIYLLFSLTLFSLIAFLYLRYREQINFEFDLLVKENLTAYGVSQSREVTATINDLENTLGAIATMVETSTADPEGPWLTDYLEELSRLQAKYRVSYIPLAQLYKNLNEQGSVPEDWSTYERLSKGETVVSEVRLSRRLGNGFYFSVAVPTSRNGQVIGVLRSVLEADVLVQTLQTGYLRESIQSYLVKSDGGFVAVREGHAQDSVNILDELSKWNISQKTVDAIRDALENNRSVTYQIPTADGPIFLSIVPLAHNHWHIVNFTRSDDVSRHTRMILIYTIQTAIALMALVATAGGLIFWGVNRQKQRLDLERSRYAMLSNFTDTVLFEYSYESDTLEFTSNARCLLPLEELRVERFSKAKSMPGVPSINVSPDKAPPSGATKSVELRIRGLDGEDFWCGCQYRAIYGSNGLPAMLIGKLVDISSQKKREQGLIKRSETDPLTGLFNKATTEARVRHYLQKDGARGFLLMIDIDNFKLINDNCGHTAGDQTLAAFGETMRGVFRGSDLLGRVGGDEFVAFMMDTDDRKAAERKAKLLVEHIAAIRIEGVPPNILSGSIGIAAYPTDGESFSDLFGAADAAMYAAKQDGKNTFTFYGDDGIHA